MVLNATFTNISVLSSFGELFRPVLQRVQMNFIFNDNVRILCLICNVKKVGKLIRFKHKGSHWQTLSHNVVSSTPRHEQGSTSQL
jgi:hypothetical protein